MEIEEKKGIAKVKKDKKKRSRIIIPFSEFEEWREREREEQSD